MLDRSDNQDVGLEAAIIERVRNSSLVEWSSAENPTGLKPGTEALDARHLRMSCVVEERSQCSEGGPWGPLERWEVRMPERVAKHVWETYAPYA